MGPPLKAAENLGWRPDRRLPYLPSMGPPLKAAENQCILACYDAHHTLQWGRR